VLWAGALAGADAVVEASLVGPGVSIGPHALVRGALLGEGSVVSDHSKTCWESPR
jgi:ADP-glucose pyrophosphorylase